MHLQYNGFNHAENEVGINIAKQAIYGPSGNRQKERQIWTITGVVLADTESALSSAMAAVENAYSTNGGDLLLYGNAGTLTRHFLHSAATINGTQVQSFHWLPGNAGIWGMATEYVNKRSYRVVVTAERLWADSNLVAYQTSLVGIGTTGPKVRYASSLTGYPQPQTLQAHTTQRIIQSGMAIGLTSSITPDFPLFPAYEQLDARRIVVGSAQHLGINQNTHFPTRWTYFFETPLLLMP